MNGRQSSLPSFFIAYENQRAEMFGTRSQAWESEYQTWYDQKIQELKKKTRTAN